MKTIFLDVETTGVEDTDRLCQLAFRLDGKYHDELFLPPVPMSVDAMSICHITNEMLASKPAFIGSESFKLLQDRFSDPESVFVAHNAQFDMKFLEREGLTLPVKHICTMKIAHHHDSKGELQKFNLQFLRYNYNLKFNMVINPHDAMSDIIVLEALFDFYNQFYTIEEMIEISSWPILLKKMMFGKYKQKTFDEIVKEDRDYLKWMYREVEMDENLKYTVTYWLSKTKQ